LRKLLTRDGEGDSNMRGWAIGIALGIHIVALCILAALTFARPAADNLTDSPQASIGQIKSLAEAAAITPKPKVIEAALVARPQNIAKSWTLPTLSQEYRIPTGSEQPDLTALAAKTTADKTGLSAAQPRARRIEFFGNYSYDRKVCFVVDCSGSMSGLLGQVVRQLKKTIDSLEPDQHFCIIFFGGSTLHEFENGKMVRATPQNKEAAYKFAKSIKPSGKTDAMRAIKRAMEIADSRGNKPAVIYFLTDGFELDGAQGRQFCKKIAALRQKLSPNVKLNTIGFWSQQTDRPMLEVIANESGGQCVLISSERN
jgi:hypothetical protein